MKPSFFNPISALWRHYPAHLARHLVWWARLSRADIAENVSFHLPTRISGNGKLRFGPGCRVGEDVSFEAATGSLVEFQSNASVGKGTRIITRREARATFAEGASIQAYCELSIANRWTIGSGAALEPYCSICDRENGFQNPFSVGEHSCVGTFTLIDTTGGVTIGNHVALGPCCIIYSHDHEPAIGREGVWKGRIKTGPVVIGHGAWIGARVTILPDVTIGEQAVVGAGAIVTSNIPASTLAVGVPARVIKNLAA